MNPIRAVILSVLMLAAAQVSAACQWPAWEQFKNEYVSTEGRVVDPADSRKITTSEGQSYALFFALAANDRDAFGKLFQWTQNNLAAGDLRAHLPGWLWGKKDDEQWTLLDSNSASDSDLWIAWALLEAGRLWQQPQYTETGKALLARIVAVANYYDELCNPTNIANALTPHEALATMFAKLRAKFDPKLLQVFVRCLGVYPPGTIVQLSNGVIGMVATINTAKPMKPMVVVYDAEIPKEEAILVDLERETDLNIAKAIRPAQVPVDIYNYLSPRKRVSYYFDAGNPGQAKGAP